MTQICSHMHGAGLCQLVCRFWTRQLIGLLALTDLKFYIYIKTGTNNYSGVRTISNPFLYSSGYSIVFIFIFLCSLGTPCFTSAGPSFLIYLNVSFKALFSNTMQCYSSPANTSLYKLPKRKIARVSFRAGNTDSSSVM